MPAHPPRGGHGFHTRAHPLAFAAWQVSVFMGLQSLGIYTTIAWLPSILHDHGVGETAAGWQLFLFQIVGLVSSTALPVLVRRGIDQRFLAAAASAIVALAFALLAVAPQLAVVSSVLTGLGGGACLVLAGPSRASGRPTPHRRQRWPRWPSPSAT